MILALLSLGGTSGRKVVKDLLEVFRSLSGKHSRERSDSADAVRVETTGGGIARTADQPCVNDEVDHHRQGSADTRAQQVPPAPLPGEATLAGVVHERGRQRAATAERSCDRGTKKNK